MQATVNTTNFDDKEILTDALASEKFAADSYNTFSCEAATPQVRQNFLSLLSEEHEIQNSIFLEMSKRGWYPTPAAEQQKIDDARVKYRNMAPKRKPPEKRSPEAFRVFVSSALRLL